MSHDTSKTAVWIGWAGWIVMAAVIPQVQAANDVPAKRIEGNAGSEMSPARGKASRADEPCLRSLSLPKATAYLDGGAHAREKNCLACHDTFAYMAARRLTGPPTSTYRQSCQALEEFASKLAAAKLSARETPANRVSETVMTATVLAQYDADTHKKLQPLTRKVLDRIWDLQRGDGGWNWVKQNEPPSGIDDHYGATMAAIGVGVAPDGYSDTPQAQKGLDRIRHYLREHPPTNLHQRGMLLWANQCVAGLLTPEQSQQTVADLFALQQSDGGWTMANLGDWKRADGTPSDRKASDGYGTGFVVYVLRRGGQNAASDSRLQKGLAWLNTHQRASGCWFTRSPYKNDEVSTYAGTALAILAIDACAQTPVRKASR
jgi:squalene-hopene/tetraprenyl-beta-curcumene cyclase